MSVSPAVFESASQRTEHYIPGVYSRSNNVTSPSGVNAGNLVILGSSNGGKPGTLLTFGSLSEAKEELLSGELLNAVGYAFNGSKTYIPQRVSVMRVNQGTRASLILKDSSEANILNLKAWDYGAHTNLVKAWVQEGTKTGSYKISVGYKDDVSEIDNIIQPSISITYVGEGTTAGVEVTTTGIKLSANTESAEIDKYEISFEDCPTLANLATRITDTGVYVAEVLDLTTDASSYTLDTTTSPQSVLEGGILYSNLDAIITAFNSIPWIGEVSIIPINKRVVPVITDGYVYFTGGSTPVATLSDYAECLEKLKVEDIQIVTTPSTNEDVQILISAHCTEMSSTINRKERTAIFGGGIGETDTNAITKAIQFNNRLVSYITDSGVASNPVTGEKETIPGSMIAVMLAGMEAGMSVAEPLTFKSLNLLAISNKRTNSNMENLIKAGVMVVNTNPDNSSEIVCIRAMTTFQGNNDLINCERSMVREDIYMNRDLRNRFSNGIGRTNDVSTDKILGVLNSTAREWANAGYIVPAENGYVFDEKVSFSGDKVYLTYSRYLTAPRNFVFITATNKLYETSIEL